MLAVPDTEMGLSSGGCLALFKIKKNEIKEHDAPSAAF